MHHTYVHRSHVYQAEHSEISRSREISRDLDSFFLARPRDFERKYLALVSNSEMFRKKSRSRLEL